MSWRSQHAVKSALPMTRIAEAVRLLRAGALVAFPTETVYGLGADARNNAAVEKIFRLKGRPVDHPVIVHLPDASHLERWAKNIPDAAYQLAQTFWPGPLTIILQRHQDVPAIVSGGQQTIGLRIPNHPVALELLRAFNDGVAAPSANRFGHISPTTAAHVRDEFGDAVSMILDGGDCEVGIESTIVDLSGFAPRILRPGMISTAEIAAVLKRDVVSGNEIGRETPRVSGSLDAHYAPRSPLQLLSADEIAIQVQRAITSGQCMGVLAIDGRSPELPNIVWQSASGDPKVFAHELYSHMRKLDAQNLSLIIVQQVPKGEKWSAIADRLKRAAAGSGGAE